MRKLPFILQDEDITKIINFCKDFRNLASCNPEVSRNYNIENCEDCYCRNKCEFKSKRILMCVYLGSYLGMRSNEVVCSKAEDIDFKEKVFRVRGENAKLHKERLVPIPDFLIEELKNYIEKYSKYFKEGYLFPNLNNNRNRYAHITNDNLRHLFIKNVMQKIGLYECYKIANDSNNPRNKAKQRKLTKFHFHSLRHYFCTKIYERTGDIYAVSDLAGHSTILSSQVYVHTNLTKKRGVIDLVFNKKIEITSNTEIKEAILLLMDKLRQLEGNKAEVLALPSLVSGNSN